MAFFTKSLSQRLLGLSRVNNPSAITTCRTSLPRTAVALNHQTTAANKMAPDRGADGVFRRYLHRPSTAAALGFLPTGEALMKKLRGLDATKDQIRLDGLIPPASAVAVAEEDVKKVEDARKMLRLAQMEKVKSRLRLIEKEVVSYPEFLEICVEECSSLDLGLEYAQILDESGSVIVLGDRVFLRPHQDNKMVVKAIQSLIPAVSDPRIAELQELENQKAIIDKKAELNAKRELQFGLAYLVVQTGVFMRLTFWELTWDVMEPICSFVTSFYIIGGFAFFLRTFREPTYAGVFERRVEAKRRRLIKKMKFDLKRYNELKKIKFGL